MSAKAIILLSGGIDSTVCLALAKKKNQSCIGLSFDYGQRHRVELKSAAMIANHYCIPHIVLKLPSWGGERSSSLLNNEAVPQDRSMDAIASHGVAPTYVPARNTLFLSYAIAVAETNNAQEIVFGANADDCIPYPDCRPGFFEAMQKVADQATKQSVEGSPPKIITPLIHLTKKDIVVLGQNLNVPFDLTFSCYSPTDEGQPCKRCDACMLRQKALKEIHQE